MIKGGNEKENMRKRQQMVEHLDLYIIHGFITIKDNQRFKRAKSCKEFRMSHRIKKGEGKEIQHKIQLKFLTF